MTGALFGLASGDTVGAAVLAAYFVTVALLSVFGLHRLGLVLAYHARADRVAPATPPVPDADCPCVLVQLPVFNERYVVERLLQSVLALDWPADRLRVQLLDDSTDDTMDIARAFLHRARPRVPVAHVRRGERTGWKAGALAEGLRRDDAPFVAIFDADFTPEPDFLRRVLGSLLADERAGMVQARWGHRNRDASLLTRAQAMLLDGHFVMEHGARARSGRFFNFNGTAGVWRRAAILDAGGWAHDTLVEDLDLSYRAQLAGWRFVYRQDVVVPAELPEDARAFKSQQHRWAKGSLQAARKLLPAILAAPLPFGTKLEAAAHLLSNVAYLAMVPLLALLPAALQVRERSSLVVGLAVDLPIFVLATLNLAIFYALSARAVDGWRAMARRLPLVPFVLALGASLTPNNARAVVQALRGQASPFVRTPKGGAGAYRLPRDGQALVEIALGLLYAAACVDAVGRGFWLAAPFVLLFSAGFLLLGVGSLRPAAMPAPATTPRSSPGPRTRPEAAASPARPRPTAAPPPRAEAAP